MAINLRAWFSYYSISKLKEGCWFISSLTCIGCLPAGLPSLSSADPHLADWLLRSLPAEDHALTSAHSPKAWCKCGRSRSPLGSLPVHWCCRSAQWQWSKNCRKQTRIRNCGKLPKTWKLKSSGVLFIRESTPKLCVHTNEEMYVCQKIFRFIKPVISLHYLIFLNPKSAWKCVHNIQLTSRPLCSHIQP